LLTACNRRTDKHVE